MCSSLVALFLIIFFGYPFMMRFLSIYVQRDSNPSSQNQHFIVFLYIQTFEL